MKSDAELEDEDREFWATHDSTDFVDWSKAEVMVLPNLRPSTRSISIRLPIRMLNDLKWLAHRRDVPYQSLLKILLAERLEQAIRDCTPPLRIPDHPEVTPADRGTR